MVLVGQELISWAWRVKVHRISISWRIKICMLSHPEIAWHIRLIKMRDLDILNDRILVLC